MEITYLILIVIPVYFFYLLYGLIKRINITSKIIGLILGAVWTYLSFVAIFVTEHTASSLIAGKYIYSPGGWEGLFLMFVLPFGALIGLGEVITYSKRKNETLIPVAQRNWFSYGILLIPALGLVVFNLMIPRIYFGDYLNDLDTSKRLFQAGGEISECSKIADESLRSDCESNLKPKNYADQYKLYQEGQCEKITYYSLRYFCFNQAGRTDPEAKARAVFPNSGAVLKLGGTYDIRWTSSNAPGEQGNKCIVLAKDGALANTLSIFQNIPDSGSQKWTVPASTEVGNYKIGIGRMSPGCGYDLSDFWFTIEK